MYGKKKKGDLHRETNEKIMLERSIEYVHITRHRINGKSNGGDLF